ncbi:hypothetical protein B0T14DRAFT_515478 [Immersiella caudata]|uniref:Secreted protein n=1 Tax=Immersiella caudata TaxID=314043 RepID=A0AA39WX08_9PEZI|nr:hypothetical protein B0T14DRAFT_515478 [Immersiella caudata]
MLSLSFLSSFFFFDTLFQNFIFSPWRSHPSRFTPALHFGGLLEPEIMKTHSASPHRRARACVESCCVRCIPQTSLVLVRVTTSGTSRRRTDADREDEANASAGPNTELQRRELHLRLRGERVSEDMT